MVEGEPEAVRVAATGRDAVEPGASVVVDAQGSPRREGGLVLGRRRHRQRLRRVVDRRDAGLGVAGLGVDRAQADVADPVVATARAHAHA